MIYFLLWNVLNGRRHLQCVILSLYLQWHTQILCREASKQLNSDLSSYFCSLFLQPVSIHTTIAQCSPLKFLKLDLNIIFHLLMNSTSVPFSPTIPHYNPVFSSPLPHTWYMNCPTFSPWLQKHKKNILWCIQITKLLIM